MGWGYWGGFAPYISKAEKLRRARKAMAALVRKGVKLEPVSLDGRRDISRTWWGKAWTRNLERYADYGNRIPRGRSYVRSGAVLDLKITPNTISALVSGSRPQPYKVTVGIKSLEKKAEKKLIEKSRVSLDSMQALLSGEFPAGLKEEFFRQGTGLFPSPREITLDCSCPDWAEMCKHVAAALYGTAARLDERPDLFFTLRGIKVGDFIGTVVKQESKKILQKARKRSDRIIAAVSALFGVTMEDADAAANDAAVVCLSKKTNGQALRKGSVSRNRKKVRLLKRKKARKSSEKKKRSRKKNLV
jgi:uncharacterized Zn finger protein